MVMVRWIVINLVLQLLDFFLDLSPLFVELGALVVLPFGLLHLVAVLAGILGFFFIGSAALSAVVVG